MAKTMKAANDNGVIDASETLASLKGVLPPLEAYGVAEWAPHIIEEAVTDYVEGVYPSRGQIDLALRAIFYLIGHPERMKVRH